MYFENISIGQVQNTQQTQPFFKCNFDYIISCTLLSLLSPPNSLFSSRTSNSTVSLVDTESMRFLSLCDLLCFPTQNFNIFHISDLPVSVTKQYRIGSATQFKLVNATVILYIVYVCFPDLWLSKLISRSKMQRISTST